MAIKGRQIGGPSAGMVSSTSADIAIRHSVVEDERGSCMRKGLLLGATGVFAALVIGPAAANATTVYQGSDYAYNVGYGKVTACDGETDGHSAYSDYTADSGNGRTKTSGGSGTCASASMSGLRSFNACEQIPAYPDACSSRVYP